MPGSLVACYLTFSPAGGFAQKPLTPGDFLCKWGFCPKSLETDFSGLLLGPGFMRLLQESPMKVRVIKGMMTLKSNRFKSGLRVCEPPRPQFVPPPASPEMLMAEIVAEKFLFSRTFMAH